MADCLGIDLGAAAATLAVVSRSKSGLKIRAFESRQYPADVNDPAARAAFASRLVIDSGFSRLPAALSVSGTDVFLRPVTVPFTKRSQIARTLKFELEGVLFFDVESAVIDFTILSSAQGNTRLLVAALQEAALRQVLTPLEDAGIKLRHVTADVLSAGALARIAGEQDFALLNVGLAGWKLSICAGGKLIFARAAQAAPAMPEMEASINAWYKQGLVASPGIAVPKVYITGEGSEQLDLARLSDGIGVPVEAFAPPAALVDGEVAALAQDMGRVGVPAISAAAECCFGGDFDFHAIVGGRQSLLDKAFAPAAAGLVILTLLFGIVGYTSLNKARSMRGAAFRVASDEASLWMGLFGAAKPIGDVHSSLKAAASELEQGISDEAKGGNAAPVLKALTVLAKSVPRDQKVTFKIIDAKEGRVTATADAPEPRMEETIVAAINKDGMFKATSAGRTGDNQQWEFDITMEPVGRK